MDDKNQKSLETMQYEQIRIEDAVYEYARKHGLKDFYSKWTNKEYSDPDHSLMNMIFDFLDAMKEESK